MKLLISFVNTLYLPTQVLIKRIALKYIHKIYNSDSILFIKIYQVAKIHIKIIYKGGARGVMVFVIGNGHADTSSNPGRDWLHFT